MYVCGLASTSIYAQTASDYVKAADAFYEKGDYYSAAINYEKFLTGKTGPKVGGYNPYVVQKVSQKSAAINPASRKEMIFKLAESYRMLHYYSNAETYYKEAMAIPGQYPTAGYWYAKSLKANNKTAEAEVAFNEYLAANTADDEYTKDAKKELANISFAKNELKKKDLYKYKVSTMNALSDGKGATYAAAFSSDGSLVYTTTKPDTTTVAPGKNPYTNKLVKTTLSETGLGSGEKLDIPTTANYEQGVGSLSPDGSKLVLTRWIMEKGKKASALYVTEKTGASWSAPTKLGTEVNKEGSNSQQPFITTDGKWLLFSSDREGGSGKFDLWYVSLDASFAPSGTATNLGSSINTDGDDEAPFYHAPSQTLVYSSNGKLGMGGLDFFYSKGNFSTWETPKNMGYPVNSVKDDLYYNTSDKKSIWNNALISSDRNSPCCLELFAFDKMKVQKTITGKVVDCNGSTALSGATVTITSENGKVIATKTTGVNGSYELKLDDYEALKIGASLPGYKENSIDVIVPADQEMEGMATPAICLTKPVVDTMVVPEINEEVVLDDVLYDFGKANLKKSSLGALDKLILLMQANPTITVELGAHTDNIGSDAYNQILSEKRATACLKYLVSKGIDASRLTSKGYGETEPIAENTINGKDNPKGRAKNRRTAFKVLSK